MLKSLHIENIAVIERADVDFPGGLGVLTGETGAGKSVMIDALNAVLGSRTSRELVRTGAEKALVTASFENEYARRWCEENDIEADDDEIVLSRRLTSDGRSSARVNGVPVSAAQLRELGGLLLDIHGQNDGRQLLDERRHMDYLDRYGADDAVLQAYREDYARYRGLRREADRLRMDESEKMQREDALRARISELENARLRAGEEAELTARRDLLHNSEKLTEQLERAYEALYSGDENALSLCSEAAAALERASAWSPDLSEAADLLSRAGMLMEDAAERSRDRLSELDFSPEEYDSLEERLAKLRRLEKKYAADEAGLIALLEESRSALDDLEYAGDRLEKLERDISAAAEEALSSARRLTDSRLDAAEKLRSRVEGELRDLNMPSVRFRVDVKSGSSAGDLTADGLDEVRFLMSANAGEEPGPISRIASGGELSRIMLALKNVFAENDTVDSLIFDEIDTGVSGLAAQRVAEKLAALAVRRQVLCVTHLPQIAAMADHQFLVEKEELYADHSIGQGRQKKGTGAAERRRRYHSDSPGGRRGAPAQGRGIPRGTVNLRYLDNWDSIGYNSASHGDEADQ